MHERRTCIRWRLNKQGQMYLENQAPCVSILLQDISFKGARISLTQRLPTDSFLKIKLSLSEEIFFNLEIWVVWHKNVCQLNAYGFYFTKIKDSDKEKIYNLVQRNSPEEIRRHWWKDVEQTKGGGIMDDRRIFERIPAQLPLRVLDLKESKEYAACTKDISAKGMGLVVKSPVVIHTPVEIWLDIPDKGEPLYTRGEVVWSRRQGDDDCRLGVNLEKADLMGVSRVLRAL